MCTSQFGGRCETWQVLVLPQTDHCGGGNPDARDIGDSARRDLRMIGLIAKQRVQKWLAGWLVASASRLHGDEHGVDLRQLLGIIKAHHPSPVGFVVHIKYTQIHWRSRLSLRGFALAPDLERAGFPASWFPVQIKRLENDRVSLR